MTLLAKKPDKSPRPRGIPEARKAGIDSWLLNLSAGRDLVAVPPRGAFSRLMPWWFVIGQTPNSASPRLERSGREMGLKQGRSPRAKARRTESRNFGIPESRRTNGGPSTTGIPFPFSPLSRLLGLPLFHRPQIQTEAGGRAARRHQHAGRAENGGNAWTQESFLPGKKPIGSECDPSRWPATGLNSAASG